jgi:hypothetical protein
VKSRQQDLLFPHILTPEEWNRVVDALDQLDGRTPLEKNGGQIRLTGDGSTTTFYIPHGLTTTPTVALVSKASPNLPDIDYHTADETNITVTFKSAPPSGDFYLWWLALRW